MIPDVLTKRYSYIMTVGLNTTSSSLIALPVRQGRE